MKGRRNGTFSKKGSSRGPAKWKGKNEKTLKGNKNKVVKGKTFKTGKERNFRKNTKYESVSKGSIKQNYSKRKNMKRNYEKRNRYEETNENIEKLGNKKGNGKGKKQWEKKKHNISSNIKGSKKWNRKEEKYNQKEWNDEETEEEGEEEKQNEIPKYKKYSWLFENLNKDNTTEFDKDESDYESKKEKKKFVLFKKKKNDSSNSSSMKKKKKGGISLNTFKNLGLSENMCKSISRNLRYNKPTEIQKVCIPSILRGKDVICISKTGSGKSLVYLSTLIDKLKEHNIFFGIRGLIILPTKELAVQIYKLAKKLCSLFFNLNINIIIGGVSVVSQFELLKENIDILICCPGRFSHILEETKLSLEKVEMLIIDEADRLLELNYYNEMNIIYKYLHKANKQTILISATLPTQVENYFKLKLVNAEICHVSSDTIISDQLRLHFLFCRSYEKYAILLKLILLFKKKKLGKTIIFFCTKYHILFFSKILQILKIQHAILYGNADTDFRMEQIRSFTENPKIQFFLVTDLAARGINIISVENVINYNLPFSSKLFIHRVGRACRDGQTGYAISIVTYKDIVYAYEIAFFIGKNLLFGCQHRGEKAIIEDVREKKNVKEIKEMDEETNKMKQLLEDMSIPDKYGNEERQQGDNKEKESDERKGESDERKGESDERKGEGEVDAEIEVEVDEKSEDKKEKGEKEYEGRCEENIQDENEDVSEAENESDNENEDENENENESEDDEINEQRNISDDNDDDDDDENHLIKNRNEEEKKKSDNDTIYVGSIGSVNDFMNFIENLKNKDEELLSLMKSIMASYKIYYKMRPKVSPYTYKKCINEINRAGGLYKLTMYDHPDELYADILNEEKNGVTQLQSMNMKYEKQGDGKIMDKNEIDEFFNNLTNLLIRKKHDHIETGEKMEENTVEDNTVEMKQMEMKQMEMKQMEMKQMEMKQMGEKEEEKEGDKKEDKEEQIKEEVDNTEIDNTQVDKTEVDKEEEKNVTNEHQFVIETHVEEKKVSIDNNSCVLSQKNDKKISEKNYSQDEIVSFLHEFQKKGDNKTKSISEEIREKLNKLKEKSEYNQTKKKYSSLEIDEELNYHNFDSLEKENENETDMMKEYSLEEQNEKDREKPKTKKKMSKQTRRQMKNKEKKEKGKKIEKNIEKDIEKEKEKNIVKKRTNELEYLPLDEIIKKINDKKVEKEKKVFEIETPGFDLLPDEEEEMMKQRYIKKKIWNAKKKRYEITEIDTFTNKVIDNSTADGKLKKNNSRNKNLYEKWVQKTKSRIKRIGEVEDGEESKKGIDRNKKQKMMTYVKNEENKENLKMLESVHPEITEAISKGIKLTEKQKRLYNKYITGKYKESRANEIKRPQQLAKEKQKQHLHKLKSDVNYRKQYVKKRKQKLRVRLEKKQNLSSQRTRSVAIVKQKKIQKRR